MYGNDEQRAAYLDALETEKDGYAKRVEGCKIAGDDAGAAFYQNQIDQVDAEIAAVNASVADDAEVDDVDADEATPSKSKAKASS